MASEAKLLLYSTTGALIETATVALGDSGSFTYAADTARDASVIATATVNGHRGVIARGRIRHHKLILVFRDLRLPADPSGVGAHGQRTVIGHTTLMVC